MSGLHITAEVLAGLYIGLNPKVEAGPPLTPEARAARQSWLTDVAKIVAELWEPSPEQRKALQADGDPGMFPGMGATGAVTTPPGIPNKLQGGSEVSNYYDHLDREWDVLGWPREIGPEPEDKESKEYGEWLDNWPQAMLYQHMRELLEVFAGEHHSGSSARNAVSLFEKLALFKPLSPLTGADDEWNAGSLDPSTLQNKRCSHVFKDVKMGRAYDIQAVIFRDEAGFTFTSGDSRRDVTFPYTPKSVYQDAPAEDA